MHPVKALTALLAIFMLAPAASAEISFAAPEGDAAPFIPFDGASTLEFTASLSCDEFIMGASPGPTQTRTVSIGYPDGFTGPETVDVSFDGAICIESMNPTGSVASNGTVDVTPGPRALSIIPQELTLTLGDATGTVPFSMQYKMGYRFDVNQEFPVTVNKDEEGNWVPIEWTAVITLDTNGDTMVMMQVLEKTQYGNLDGLFANAPKNFRDLTGDDIENGMTQIVNFRYTPTAEGWEEDHVHFNTWSHYFFDTTQGQTPDQEVVWTFVNGDFEEGSNGAPGPSAALIVLALAGAALVATRRRI